MDVEEVSKQLVAELRSKVAGAVVGWLLGLALGAFFQLLEQVMESVAAAFPAPVAATPLVRLRPLTEAILFYVSTVLAVAEALADVEKLVAILSLSAALLSVTGYALSQNPLFLLPLVLPVLLRVALIVLS
jgi:hypothetical protein